MVTPTNSPVIYPSFITRSLIIPDEANNFSTAASPILAKSILA